MLFIKVASDHKRSLTEDSILCLANELITNHFPELHLAHKEKRIFFKGLKTPSYYFKTWQHSGVFSNKKQNRIYSIRVNKDLFFPTENSYVPSKLAIQGILAHELFHIVDYEEANSGGFILNQMKEMFTNKIYERYTDLRAMLLGFSEGLKLYRLWIYSRLSGHALKMKKKRYYTPEEIDEWLETDFSKDINIQL